MRLRTTESYWLIKNGLLHSYPCFSKNQNCDIAVIGAGITGALVSHALLQAGYKVVVIDKGDVAYGSTSATTSMLQYEVDKTLSELTDLIGFEEAGRAYLAGVEAISDLQKLIKSEKLEGDFELKDSLYLAHSEKANEDLKEELKLRLKLKIPVKHLSASQVKRTYGLESHGALLSKVGASIDAYKLTHSLLFKNCQRRSKPLQVFDQSEIKKTVYSKTGATLEFANGAQLKCKKIVYCTGFEATTLLKEKVADLFDTYACISEIQDKIPASLHKTLVWNTQDPYFYSRTTTEGRILIGGQDSSFRMSLLREKLKLVKSSLLISQFQKIAPQLNFVEDFTWAGTFGKTKDSLPYIGKSLEHPHTYFVLGFGGNGITFSVQAMKILPELLKGRTSQLAQLYRFGR